MEHIDRPRIHRCEHEKKIHKLSHHEQQDLIATPWQIWEKEETNEYKNQNTTKLRKIQKNETKNKYE
jgi:hypothetical protein